uniref:Uncharacterized protein n=1 Tax=Arundo donax TaxID=35708 RepID=A0A0A9A0X8_ARUDO
MASFKTRNPPPPQFGPPPVPKPFACLRSHKKSLLMKHSLRDSFMRKSHVPMKLQIIWRG